MKHNEDKRPYLINQEEKDKCLRDLLTKFEDCCYVMISAVKAYRKTFGISKEEEK